MEPTPIETPYPKLLYQGTVEDPSYNLVQNEADEAAALKAGWFTYDVWYSGGAVPAADAVADEGQPAEVPETKTVKRKK